MVGKITSYRLLAKKTTNFTKPRLVKLQNARTIQNNKSNYIDSCEQNRQN